MISPVILIMLGTALSSLGMWLVLPRGRSGGRTLGAVIAAVGAVLLVYPLPRLADWGPAGGWSEDIQNAVFLGLAGVTIVSAVCSVSLRSPVYCAIWFALTLLGTAALFMFQGAQFLGVATVVVYAGAILVTFLFVLMLAQPEGHAYYDRISWEALLSATTGAVMVGILTTIVVGMSQSAVPARGEQMELGSSNSEVAGDETLSPAAAHSNVLRAEHMAGLGGELFGRHLIAIEAAGVLLFVALVGAVAIVAHEKQQAAAGNRAPSEAMEGRTYV